MSTPNANPDAPFVLLPKEKLNLVTSKRSLLILWFPSQGRQRT